MTRSVDDCTHRLLGTDESADVAACDLLRKVSGVADYRFAQVERSACEACCHSFVPTIEDWNPIVASLLHQLADRLVESGGTDGCTSGEAARLQEAALLNLPVVLPDEDDGLDDVQWFVPPKSLSLAEMSVVLPPPPGSNAVPTPRWAVGVTTAPRRQATLSTCLDSLIVSGWDRPHLFADGLVDIDKRFSVLPRTDRPASLGAWPAWCAAVKTLLKTDPSADAILVVQDDALFPQLGVLREYIDTLLWPGGTSAIVSLYTSTDDMLTTNTWRPLPTVWKYGALAFAFSPEIARGLLKSAKTGELDFVQGTAGIDSRIGLWADRNNVPIWHPSPSLVQHIGQVSSVWKHSRAVGLRRASRFVVDEL